MVEQHGMIDRSRPGRSAKPPDGHRDVSYRTSSYGYDIRCASEFKVFTNIYSTVVGDALMRFSEHVTAGGSCRTPATVCWPRSAYACAQGWSRCKGLLDTSPSTSPKASLSIASWPVASFLDVAHVHRQI